MGSSGEFISHWPSFGALKKKNKKSPKTQNCRFSFVTPKHKAIHPRPTLMGIITFLVSVIRLHESAGLVCLSALPPGTTLQGFSLLRHRCTPPKYGGVTEARCVQGTWSALIPAGWVMALVRTSETRTRRGLLRAGAGEGLLHVVIQKQSSGEHF